MSVDKKELNAGNNLSSALSEAQSIIEAAEQRAEEILANAEQRHASAEQEGFDRGFEAGRRDAAEQAIHLIENSAIVAERLSEEAAKLAIGIASAIIEEHVSVKPDTAAALARNAIRQSVVGATVTIAVHPADVEALEKLSPEFQRLAEGASIAIEKNPLLARGGCIVKTEFGEVDASIETLVSSIAERLGVSTDGNR